LKKIIILGGGISGLCSAYYLVKEGYDVTVIDRNDITTGASFINAGYITPSHFISLAAPGMISKGIRWMFDSSSPFYVKPRLDFDFFKWVLRFKQSATLDKVEKAIPVLKDINLKSQGLYEEILSSLDFQFHYERSGLLMAYCSVKSEEEELKIAERAQKEGLEARHLTREQLRKIQPDFSEKILGAIHYECDSHTTPSRFMLSMKNWLKENGVHFELNHEINKINFLKNKIVSVESKNATFELDELVLATGSWTSSLVKSLGLNIPVQGGKGYSMDVYRSTGITIPAVLVEAKVAVTPMDGFVRFAGTMEFSGNNSIIRSNRVEAIANSVKNYYRNIELTGEEKEAAHSGLRPVSPDGLPYIGKSSKYENLTIATGHSMMGWSLGPITGKLVSQLIAKKNPSINLDPFKPERFK
jgi:D-amino-acid dehydrogenase